MININSDIVARAGTKNLRFASNFKYSADEDTDYKSRPIKYLFFYKVYTLSEINKHDAINDFSAFIKQLDDNHKIMGFREKGFYAAEFNGELKMFASIYVLTSNHAAATSDAAAFTS